MPAEERKRSQIYNDLFVPRRMANYAGMRFDLDGREEWFCFVMRSEESGVIDGPDAAAFVRVARTAMNVASIANATDANWERNGWRFEMHRETPAGDVYVCATVPAVVGDAVVVRNGQCLG